MSFTFALFLYVEHKNLGLLEIFFFGKINFYVGKVGKFVVKEPWLKF